MQISPKYPDFKHKITNEALWLDNAPDWVLQKIDRLVSCDSKSTAKNAKGVSQKIDRPLFYDSKTTAKNEKGRCGAFTILTCALCFFDSSFKNTLFSCGFLMFFIAGIINQ